MEFNIFNVLSKDNKELIHSAFLKWILEEIPELFIDLFGCKTAKNVKIFTEYTFKEERNMYKKNKGVKFAGYPRIDLKCVVDDDVVYIENKFKSVANERQLKLYDEIIQLSKNKSIKKFLLTFDTPYIKLKNWEYISYNHLCSKFSNVRFDQDKNSEKDIFLTHYLSILNLYMNRRKKVLQNPASLFKGSKKFDVGDFNFWKIILLGELYQRLQFTYKNMFRDDSKPGTGDATSALLDIYPTKWSDNSYFIQIQDDLIKLFSTFGEKTSMSTHKKIIQNAINFFDGKYYRIPLNPNSKSDEMLFSDKKLVIGTNSDAVIKVDGVKKISDKVKSGKKSCYLYQQKISKINIASMADLEKFVVEFYKIADDIILKSL